MRFLSSALRPVALLAGWLLGACSLFAQTAPAPRDAPGEVRLSLNDLSVFRTPTANWRLGGAVTADPDKPNALTAQPGAGVLANLPDAQHQGNLLTSFAHGDMDLDLDFMLARHSNSGVYLQGRYEVQLFDSWGTLRPGVADVGSIYERWDDTKPTQQQGYDGHPARQNAARAPGLWQHLHIVFQAPRFDASGRKTENARFLRVDLNGVTVQENIELTGPTRAAAFADEAATGPIMLQGDHGPVAFRNLRYTLFDKKRPELRDIRYALFKGKFVKESDLKENTPPEAEGPLPGITGQLSNLPPQFLIRYTGILRVNEPGRYQFAMQVPGGGGRLRINNQPVLAKVENRGSAQIDLPAGDLPIELVYSKPVEWTFPSIELVASGPGIRPFGLTADVTQDDVTDPILIDAATQPLLRSFMDLPGADLTDEAATGTKRHRVTHGISVGDARVGVHYSYDLDNGSLVQVWRGQFLDATPMWHDRGDGSARPLGMTQRFGKPALALAALPSPTAPWPTDTTGSGFRPNGYSLDATDQPSFLYHSYGHAVTDQIRPLPTGEGIQRQVTVSQPGPGLAMRLASGKQIELVGNKLYAIDKAYYIRLENTTTASLRTVNGRQELIAPVTNTPISYTLLF